MIISASRRTDLPAFHASWFMERIREGEVIVSNPFNRSSRKTVSLRPEDVDVIVFWTRNARPILSHLEDLEHRGFQYVFLYTITGYGPPLEKLAPPLEEALETFKTLSHKIGPERIIWRFDPIVHIAGKGEEWVIARFEKIVRALRNDTERVIVSFLDLYRKVVRRLALLEQESGLQVVDSANEKDVVRRIATALVALASENNVTIQSCAEKTALEQFGIKPGSCIDGALLNKIFGLKINVGKDRNQRTLCRCTASQDIGEYNTCRYGCAYCYAVR
jgi:DNA repair photolyase